MIQQRKTVDRKFNKTGKKGVAMDYCTMDVSKQTIVFVQVASKF